MEAFIASAKSLRCAAGVKNVVAILLQKNGKSMQITVHEDGTHEKTAIRGNWSAEDMIKKIKEESEYEVKEFEVFGLQDAGVAMKSMDAFKFVSKHSAYDNNNNNNNNNNNIAALPAPVESKKRNLEKLERQARRLENKARQKKK